MPRAVPALLAVAALAGCGDQGLKGKDTSGRGQADPAAAPPRYVIPDEAPEGEMILGLAVPDLAGIGAPDGGPAPIPSAADRGTLRAQLEAALAARRIDDAVATADLLAVLFPDDPEILELRGRALTLQGDAEGGARDFARCCDLGRAPCCAAAPR